MHWNPRVLRGFEPLGVSLLLVVMLYSDEVVYS